MFASAEDYNAACAEFKRMLGTVIDSSKEMILLDEIIEIDHLDNNGNIREVDSGLEFTESWLKDLGYGFEIIKLVE